MGVLNTWMNRSKLLLVSESFDSHSIVLEWLVTVVWVGNVSRPLLLLRTVVSLGKDLLSGDDVLLHHFAEEDVVDFDVMRRETVVQERRREHHVVSVEPKLSSILGVEHVLVSGFTESASGENKHGCSEVDKETRVVKSAIHVPEETRTNGTHGSIDSEDRHPHVVDHSESSVESVSRILSLAHFKAFVYSANNARSGSQPLINEVLQWACIFEQHGLEPLRHIY